MDTIEYHQESSEEEEDDTVKLPLNCYRQRPEGDMVGCDIPHAVISGFILVFFKFKSIPKCKHWYCPDCRKIPRFKRKKQLYINNHSQSQPLIKWHNRFTHTN